MNVLLTCAGRRAYLVQYFRTALEERGQVFAADATPSAAAMQVADGAFVVPTVHDPGYVDALLALCKQRRVGLLIPLNDLELPILAAARARFEALGVMVMVSATDLIDICFDKWRTVSFLAKSGVAVPRTYVSLESAQAALVRECCSYPVVLKPRWGSASIGIEFVEDEEALELSYRLLAKRLRRTILSEASSQDYARSILIQECLEGEEYGLDVVNDLKGNYATTFVKRKLAMRAGETDRAVTVQDDSLRALGEHLGRSLGHVGNLDCDVFVTDSGPYVLELNPRFGGGYPFSHAAGANVPAALIAWADGREPKPEWLCATPGIASAKCDRLVMISERDEMS